MVLVITQYNFPKPSTNLACTVMLPTLKFSLNDFKLRGHPLLCRNPPDGEGLVAAVLPAEVSKAQEREGLWFTL